MVKKEVDHNKDSKTKKKRGDHLRGSFATKWGRKHNGTMGWVCGIKNLAKILLKQDIPIRPLTDIQVYELALLAQDYMRCRARLDKVMLGDKRNVKGK